MNKLLVKSLRVYLLIPLAVVIVLIDKGLHLGFIESLPNVPEKWLYFNFIFNVPHIVASNMLLMNGDVYHRYGKKILWALLLAILATGIFHYYLNLKAFLYIHSIWTLKHVILQQFNLGHSLGLTKKKRVEIWKGLAVLLGIILYWDIYGIYRWKEIAVYPYLLHGLGGLFLLSSFSVFQLSANRNAKLMTFANASLIFISYLLYVKGASLISVLLIRVIHDCTSFVFYQAVNEGKLQKGRASLFLKVSSNHIGTSFSTVLPPILIVIFLYLLPFRREVFSIFMVLSIMHYFTEGFTWKADGSHRQYLEA